jgi:hypothetical protein
LYTYPTLFYVQSLHTGGLEKHDPNWLRKRKR